MKTSFEVVADNPLATTNGRDVMHRFARARYTKTLREIGRKETQSWINLLLRKGVRISTNCRVEISFTRYGKKPDDDNISGCFKAIRDGIADAFCGEWKTLNKKKQGDDSDPRFTWNKPNVAPKRGNIRGLVEIEVIQ